MTHFIIQWNSPPADYRIDHNTVHVWQAHFQPSMVSDRKFLERLSRDEMEKAQRYIRQSDRDRYIFSHGLLRSLLGAYVGCAPQQLVFETEQDGKPFLAASNSSDSIRFNMSHSENMVLIGVTRGIEVGIDVEHIRRIPDARQIVNSIFSVDERKFLNSVPPGEFEEGFFAYWTSKEAFLKGIGKGLLYPLDRFSVTFSCGESDGLVYVHGDSDDAHCWKVIKLSPGPGYSGALALKELRNRPQFFEYDWG
jgi:4'-phosphopantetheinyl transferase